MRPSVTTKRLSGARACVGDVAVLGRAVPLFPVDRTMRLAAVAEARAAAPRRIGWAAMLAKAYALVARDMPVLRTWVAGIVRPRLATADQSVATIAMNRIEDGEDRLVWARITAPDTLPLDRLQAVIDDFQTLPLEEAFPRQLELERAPGCLRRAILRWNIRSASPKRATRLGTFSLSTLAGFGASNRFHPTLCTTSLSPAPLESGGRCTITLIADHRVLDGAAAARALERLEDTLVGTITAELSALRGPALSAVPQVDAGPRPAGGWRGAA